MPRAIVTQTLVSEASDALAAAGEEPTMITVQERIGGGSYTTIKRYLAVWKAQQQASQQPIEVPEAVAAKGAAFVRELWGAAAALAEQRNAQVRAESQRQVDAAQATLASAETAIARLEAESEEQAQQLASQEQVIAALRDELAQTHSAAQLAEARANEQTQRVADLQSLAQQRDEELAQARAAALDQARLAGELAAAQRQLQEQSALIERLARGGKAGQ